jgi:hypothetical protein
MQRAHYKSLDTLTREAILSSSGFPRLLQLLVDKKAMQSSQIWQISVPTLRRYRRRNSGLLVVIQGSGRMQMVVAN